MPYQNINTTISTADVQAVKDSFAAVLAKLPFLVNLTANERKALLKTGPNSMSFVQNAASAAQNNATIFPASFNTTDFQKDVDLLATLTELGPLAEQLGERFQKSRKPKEPKPPNT